MARGFDAPEYHAFLWRIAYYSNDVEAMQQHIDWGAASSTWAFNIPALAAALQGRWRASLEWSSRASAFFEIRGMSGLTLLAAPYDAMSGALVGDCETAGRQARLLRDAPAVSADEQARAALALAMCGRPGDARRVAEGLRNQQPARTAMKRIWLPSIEAASWLADKQPAMAIEVLRAIDPYDGAAESWPVYLRGLAWLDAGQGANARAAFQDIIDHRGRTFWFPLHPLAHLGLARAATMTGDRAAALRA